MSNGLTVIDVPELKTIEQSRAAQIAQAFTPMSGKLAEFEEGFNEIISESSKEITDELTKKAKRLRLDIGKIRIETGKIKDKQKENIKLEDKAIMGVHNWLVLAVKEKEDRLSDIEKYFEKIQEEKRHKLHCERVDEVLKYTDDATGHYYGSMPDDVWNAFVFKLKVDHEARIEAEKKAEAERIENERLDKLENERHLEILPYRQFWNVEKYELRVMSQCDFDTLINDLSRSKEDYDKEQEKIRLENELLRKEAEEKEKRRIAEEKARKEAEQKERKIREEKERKEREAQEAALKKEREERELFEHEEREKREKLEEELRLKKEAEERAKAAEESRIQTELNKGDAEKVSDLIDDLKSLQVKYTFKSKKNQKMYSDVIILIDKIITHIEN